MPDTDLFSDQEIVARTVWGEARGEGLIGQQAVINVIFNRVASPVIWWGKDPRSVCLKPYQFSCWLAGDPNRPKLLAVAMDDPIYTAILELTIQAFGNKLPDITGSSDSYKVIGSFAKWAINLQPVKVIGHHEFYKTV